MIFRSLQTIVAVTLFAFIQINNSSFIHHKNSSNSTLHATKNIETHPSNWVILSRLRRRLNLWNSLVRQNTSDQKLVIILRNKLCDDINKLINDLLQSHLMGIDITANNTEFCRYLQKFRDIETLKLDMKTLNVINNQLRELFKDQVKYQHQIRLLKKK
eukprot:315168_1